MLKAKKIILSLVVMAFMTMTIGALTSCGKEDDITVIDKENFATVKNEYQQYVEQYPNATKPEGVDIAINGVDYDENSVTLSETGLVTSVSKLNIQKESVNPEGGNKAELIKLVQCFTEENVSGYSDAELKYIYESVYETQVSTTVTDSTRKTTLDELAAQIKNLVKNNKSQSNEMLIHESTGRVSWKVNVEESGFYNLYLNYFTVTGYSSSIERKLLIKTPSMSEAKVPFSGADTFTFSRVWNDTASSYDKNGNLKVDTNGNDLKPQQVETFTFRNSYFKDSMGYVTEPYMFYLEKGENEITLISIKEPMIIDQIHILSVDETLSYDEYLIVCYNNYNHCYS